MKRSAFPASPCMAATNTKVAEVLGRTHPSFRYWHGGVPREAQGALSSARLEAPGPDSVSPDTIPGEAATALQGHAGGAGVTVLFRVLLGAKLRGALRCTRLPVPEPLGRDGAAPRVLRPPWPPALTALNPGCVRRQETQEHTASLFLGPKASD